jgi:hypothetical protein
VLVAALVLAATAVAPAAPLLAADRPSARLLVTLAAADVVSDGDVDREGGDVVHRAGRVLVVEPDRHGVAARLAALDGVVAVEDDVTVRPASFDPGYPQQWGLENTGQRIAGRAGIVGADADVPDAWRFGRGQGAVVAIVDGALDLDHEDLRGAIWRNPDEVRNGVDDDGNGWVDDLDGIDLTDRDTDLRAGAREERHGTELAGVVGARTDNGIGVAGVAHRAQVLPVRFIADGVGQLSDALEGLAYALDEGADVVVLSWIGAEDVVALRTAIADAGVPVVVPAGNEGRTLDAPRPGVAVPNLVVVGALDNLDQLPNFTNRGRAGVDLLAPGWQVLTTTSDDEYARVSGTSLAAAFVGGALGATLGAAPPGTDAARLVELLLSSTRTEPRWRREVATSGVLDHEAFAEAVVLTRRDDLCPAPDSTAPPAPDVGTLHARGVTCLLELDVASGFPDGTYRPRNVLTRGQAATVLVGMLLLLGETLPEAPPDAFRDDDGTVHEADIDTLAAIGIVGGRAEGAYVPADPVRRDELASLLDRVYAQARPDVPAPSRDWFDDDDASVHERSIDRLRDLALARGTGRTTFSPASGVTRGQVATLVAGTLDRITWERALD